MCRPVTGAALLLALWSALSPLPLAGAEGGYVRKWVWSKKELRRVKAMEKKVKQEEGGGTVETRDWIVKTELGAHFTAECAVFMDLFSSTFWHICDFDTSAKLKIKPTLVVFDNPGKYMAAARMPGSRGVFSHAYVKDKFIRFHLFTYMQKGRLLSFKNCYLPVIQHEGTHALLQTLFGKRRIPCWLNEGMATFFEFWDYHGGGKPNGRGRKDEDARSKRLWVSWRKKELLPGIKQRGATYPRLKYLVSLGSHRRWGPDGMGPTTRYHYALAESFIDFLMRDKQGRKVFKNIFRRMAQAKPEDDPDALTLLTPKEIAKLEPRWYKFLAKVWGINARIPKGKED